MLDAILEDAESEKRIAGLVGFAQPTPEELVELMHRTRWTPQARTFVCTCGRRGPSVCSPIRVED
jgi:hypothetical protein